MSRTHNSGTTGGYAWAEEDISCFVGLLRTRFVASKMRWFAIWNAEVEVLNKILTFIRERMCRWTLPRYTHQLVICLAPATSILGLPASQSK